MSDNNSDFISAFGRELGYGMFRYSGEPTYNGIGFIGLRPHATYSMNPLRNVTDDITSSHKFQKVNNLLKLTILQNKSRKFNEWLFDPDHYAGRWHKKNMLRDFQDS